MRCMMCGKRVSESNSHLLSKDTGNRICKECMQQGYTKTCLEIIEHNVAVKEDGE